MKRLLVIALLLLSTHIFAEASIDIEVPGKAHIIDCEGYNIFVVVNDEVIASYLGAYPADTIIDIPSTCNIQLEGKFGESWSIILFVIEDDEVIDRQIVQ